MKKNNESQFKVQQTKLKTNAEKITVRCSQGEQSNNENKKCQAKRSEERNIRSKKSLQNRQPQKAPNTQEVSDQENRYVVTGTSNHIQEEESGFYGRRPEESSSNMYWQELSI